MEDSARLPISGHSSCAQTIGVSPGPETKSSPSIGLTGKTNVKPMQKQDPEKKREKRHSFLL